MDLGKRIQRGESIRRIRPQRHCGPLECPRRARLSLYTQPTDFVFPSHCCKGRNPLDLAAVLKRKIRPAFDKLGITGVGGHTFRHTVGTMLAEMGEHQPTIRDYLRHSNLFM